MRQWAKALSMEDKMRKKRICLTIIIFTLIAIFTFGSKYCLAISSTDKTELRKACANGDLTKVKKIVGNTSDVDIDLGFGITPLSISCEKGQLEIVQYLFNRGAKLSKKKFMPLQLAAGNGHLEIVKFIIDNGIDVNSKFHDGGTALMEASNEGHLNIVIFLITKSAKVDEKNSVGSTALLMAATRGQYDIVKILLENRADPNVKNKMGFTPLLFAYDEKTKTILKKFGAKE